MSYKHKILVLMGGTSEEREVSLRSGAAVLQALKNKGYQAAALDLKYSTIQDIEDYKPDLAFLALHGKYGEDGTIQGMLEIMGIPYTGSGVAASAICMNKILTKKILCYEGIPTAPFTVLSKDSFRGQGDLCRCWTNTKPRWWLKAVTQGSTIGTYVVRREDDLLKAVEEAFSFDDEVIVEKFIDGMELTVAIIGNRSLMILPVIEIVPRNEYYDYESKYTPGMSTHIIPARVNGDTMERVKAVSAQAFKVLGCRGCARVDVMLDRQGNPYILELNTIPGMTATSLVPDAGRAAGISWDDLVEKNCSAGLEK
jgi:D-alanine-D-alanine ligase